MLRTGAIALLACLIAWPAQAASGGLSPDRGTIFPADKAMTLAQPCSRRGPGSIEGTWTPTSGQIADLEARLPKAYDEGERALGRKGGSMPNYYRQYAGFIVGGTKIIYVNAFPILHPESSKVDWRTTRMFYCDDGTFFGVEYAIGSKTFRNYRIDGCLCPPVRKRRP